MILDWLYPKKCVGCGREGSYFCFECLESVSLRGDWRCPECNRAAGGGRTHLGCRSKYSLDGGVSLFSYRGLVRLGIQELKYQFLREIERELVKILGLSLRVKLRDKGGFEIRNFLKQKPIVAAVPLHWRREKWRGFNQAEVIAGMISNGLGLEPGDLLEKIRATKLQVKSDKEQREKNVKRAFRVKIKDVPERVLLVDDVWTTGATIRAGGEVLKRAGVKEVWGLSLAR